MAMPGLASLVTQRNHNLTSTTVIKSSQTRTCATMLALTSHYLATNAKHPRYAPRPPALPYQARSPRSAQAPELRPAQAPELRPLRLVIECRYFPYGGRRVAGPRLHLTAPAPALRPAPPPLPACPMSPARPVPEPGSARPPAPATTPMSHRRCQGHPDVTSAWLISGVSVTRRVRGCPGSGREGRGGIPG